MGEKTNYIDAIDAVYGSSDQFVSAQKDGITVLFDLEMNIEYDDVHFVKPDITYNNAFVTSSDIQVEPNEDWLNSFRSEVIEELQQNEKFKEIAEEYLTRNLDEEPDFENDDDDY